MDIKYINPFLMAVQNVFETMISIPYKLGKPFLKNDPVSSYDVSGIIGITGEVTGCVVVSFPEDIALQLASELLDDTLTEIDDDSTDAIGEIANMVAGDAKKRFPRGDTTISVPSVVIGKHRIAFPKGVPIISIPCETDKGEFAIDVALKVQWDLAIHAILNFCLPFSGLSLNMNLYTFFSDLFYGFIHRVGIKMWGLGYRLD